MYSFERESLAVFDGRVCLAFVRFLCKQGHGFPRSQTMVCNPFLQRRLDFGEAKSNFIILIIHVVVECVISDLCFYLITLKLSHKM